VTDQPEAQPSGHPSDPADLGWCWLEAVEVALALRAAQLSRPPPQPWLPPPPPSQPLAQRHLSSLLPRRARSWPSSGPASPLPPAFLPLPAAWTPPRKAGVRQWKAA